jgi:competence/damage-inducible protein CinA-like protein
VYRCSLVSIGDELLDGRVIDTNADYITEKLATLGLVVSLRIIVGDDILDLHRTLSWVIDLSDVIIITGGLGPTDDDITREALADVLGLPLERDGQAEKVIRSLFEKMGREMPPSNLKQADLLAGATPLIARLGTAPGQWIEHKNKLIVLMPGVPREMRDMMTGDIIPRLEKHFFLGDVKLAHSFFVAAKPESEVGELVRDTLSVYDNLNVSYRAQPGQIEVRVSTWGGTGALNEAVSSIREVLGPWLVAEGDATLEGNLGQELRSRGLTLAVAESCTGGMVGEWITRMPGSSDYFKGGIVAYSYDAKENLMGIPMELLKSKGAVCKEVAEAMAQSVRKRFLSNLGISVTGVAGPGSDGEVEPVGTVAFGLADQEEVHSWKYRLPGDRDMVRQVAATIILSVTYFYVRGDGKVNVR